jgi:hypothetical protein
MRADQQLISDSVQKLIMLAQAESGEAKRDEKAKRRQGEEATKMRHELGAKKGRGARGQGRISGARCAMLSP